ncbi:N-acetylmuramidase family protein [Chromobacterium sp. IIBBL 290-4]|uniref:N-acetylmuramidase domain-containing protein n=1 Tax=Chromobacterium sp. IIBBL 290-4 TaxID=2953890 RepID=UPI0020B66912|nr:N-acetylmuramidase family protein [Chromobacterium sp. IIBBL 290-4]UTH73351.1 N-acetylmuramidase family protein [Chromobacterium sp. IIBBL 290-4]
MDLMKKGAHGLDVQALQQRLAALGAKLTVDGWFGDATEAAVAAFQRRAGLVVDGIAGPKTLFALIGQAGPRRLGETDLQAAAERLGVSVSVVKAFNAVESSGSGFLADGRPVILLERHVVYQRAGEQAEQLAAQYPAICNKARGGYAGGAAEWTRFTSLAIIGGEQLAIESCSWGAFQIMGYHWQRLGYVGALEWRRAMESGEPAQLDAFVRFILAEPALLKALQAKKWADVARLYNGPAYRENLYDAKLQAAYERAERLAA